MSRAHYCGLTLWFILIMNWIILVSSPMNATLSDGFVPGGNTARHAGGDAFPHDFQTMTSPHPGPLPSFQERRGGKQLTRAPFSGSRQFWVRMNGAPWPKDGHPVSMTRLMTALRKALVKASGA